MDNIIDLKQNVAALEAVYYDAYYRQRGVRTRELLTAPKFSDITHFELPRNAIVHYLGSGGLDVGMNPSNVLLQKKSGQVFSENIMDVVAHSATPIRTKVSYHTLNENYKRAYRSIRPVKNISSVLKDDRSLLITNYAFLYHLYRYRENYMDRVWQYRNILATFVKRANELALEPYGHQQYIVFTIPTEIPSRQQLVKASSGLNRDLLKLFNTHESLFLLDLWTWLSVNRSQSILGQLTDEAISKINLIVLESSKFNMISLNVLNSLRADNDKPDHPGRIEPAEMQISLLKFINAVQVLRSVSSKDIIETNIKTGTIHDTILASDTESKIDVLNEVKELEREVLLLKEEEIETENDDDDDDFIIPTYDEEVEETQESYLSGDIETENETMELEVPEKGKVINRYSLELLEEGAITEPEHRRNVRLSGKYKTIPNPLTGTGTLEEFINLDQSVITTVEETVLADVPTVSDKSLLRSTLKSFDKKYLKEVYHKDIARMIMKVQDAGFSVIDYNINNITDAYNKSELHDVKLAPVVGAVSPFRFKLPVINADEQYYYSGGVKYFLRRQRREVPIRKINAREVGLTSYYMNNKLFIRRSAKKVNDYSNWLSKKLVGLIRSGEIEITEYGNSFNRELNAPRFFSTISHNYRGINYKNFSFIFDYNQLLEKYGEEKVNLIRNNGDMPVGEVVEDGKRRMIVMAPSGVIFTHTKQGEKSYGTLEEILNIDTSKSPIEAVTVNVSGTPIPIGYVLASKFGLINLLNRIKADYRQVLRGSRLDLNPDEYAIKFADQSLVFRRDQKLVELIVGSLLMYQKSIQLFDLEEFESDEVYSAIIDREGLAARYLREINLMYDMFVDPITEELLVRMNEPTDFGGLLLRASEMLVTDQHLNESNASVLREAGYERIPGGVYTEMINGLRSYRSKSANSKNKLDINPNAVWMRLSTDPSVSIVDELNPIQYMKEHENITYAGTGGRTSRTMVKRHRQFDKNDIGRVSEATVDNADVAVTIYSTTNPKWGTLRGEWKEWDYEKEPSNSSILSTSALLSPGADRDDGKRINFISIQQSHVIATDGYQLSPVRTGLENSIIHMAGSLYGSTSKGPGVVKKITKNLIVVAYDDPDLGEDRIELGRRYGVSTGNTIAHDLVTDLNLGDKVEFGTVLSRNEGFFAPDPLVKGQAVWKAGVIANMAIVDTSDTFEDSSAISPWLADKLSINTVHIRELTIDFSKTISQLVQIGETVETESILCIIEDSDISGIDHIGDSTDGLSMMAINAPRSKFEGKVEKIEMFYNGDLDDMPPSLRELAIRCDKERSALVSRLKNGDSPVGYASDLPIDVAVIKIYIGSRNGTADGDKIVAGHQLKSTINRVFVGVNETESGVPIDLYFGASPIDNRIVNSPIILGTTILLQQEVNRRLVSFYRNLQKRNINNA